MIRLDNVHRIFQVGDQEVHALRDVDCEIGAGEYVSIMGPSGSGKSTLLNLIGLLDTPTSGVYRFLGEEVSQLSESEQAGIRREKIGFVFQFFHLISRLTAYRNVELPLTLAGTPSSERRDRVLAALNSLGLSDRIDHRPDQLSGGQRQRVAIARAVVVEPAILLADEPTGNLDQASGDEVVQILEELNGRGLAVIVVTHDPDIGSRARRRLRMVDGRIVQDTRERVGDGGWQEG